MTFSGLFQDYLRTVSGISQEFFRTFSELLQDFLRTFSGLSQDFLRTSRPWFENLVLVCSTNLLKLCVIVYVMYILNIQFSFSCLCNYTLAFHLCIQNRVAPLVSHPPHASSSISLKNPKICQLHFFHNHNF